MSHCVKWNPFLKFKTHFDLNQYESECLRECWKEGIASTTLKTIQPTIDARSGVVQRGGLKKCI